MCRFFGISRSGYYRYVKNLDRPRKNADIADMIRQCHQACRRTSGCRRVQIWLEQEKGIRLNEKTVLRIMRDYDLFSQIRRRRSYNKAVECLRRYSNLLNREFRAKRPNQKWGTDISYIIPPLQNHLHLPVIRNAMLALVYPNNQARQPFVFQLLDACCPIKLFIIPGPADVRRGVEFVHRPMIRFMQFLDGLIGCFLPYPADVRQLIPAPAKLLVLLLYHQFHFQFQVAYPQMLILCGKSGRTMSAVQSFQASLMISLYPPIDLLVCKSRVSRSQFIIFPVSNTILHRLFTFLIRYHGQLNTSSASGRTESFLTIIHHNPLFQLRF